MAETDDRFARLSRRRFLKAGTFFALIPSSHLPAYSEAIAPASQDSGSKRPPDAHGGLTDALFLVSCHDNGWTGFPVDKNPYVAQGSRAVFGYSFLFSPMIPIFFSGEEFKATFHALADLSPDLYGGKSAGKGRWLYGAMLDWNELNQAEHRDMLTDVKKMMAIRKEHSTVLAMSPGGRVPNLKAIQHEADIEVPVSYVRWDDRAAIVIVANRNKTRDAHLTLNIVLTDIGLGERKNYVVTDLWSATRARTCAESELKDFRCTAKRDGVSGGGLCVFKIEPASLNS